MADDRRLLLGDYGYPAHVEGLTGRAGGDTLPCRPVLLTLRE